MRAWAIIEGILVVNCIVWDGVSQWAPPEGSTLVEITNIDPAPCPGWTYENNIFVSPPVINDEPEPLADDTEGPTVI